MNNVVIPADRGAGLWPMFSNHSRSTQEPKVNGCITGSAHSLASENITLNSFHSPKEPGGPGDWEPLALQEDHHL